MQDLQPMQRAPSKSTMPSARRVRPRSLLDVLDPRAEGAERHLVFFLARHRARVAADALAVVDHEAVSRHFYWGPRYGPQTSCYFGGPDMAPKPPSVRTGPG